MMPERIRFVALLAVALIVVGAWRLAAVVGAAPMLGYANQFDMARTSACVGLWPDLPAPARFEAHPQAPLSRYVRRDDPSDECYLSSVLVFVAPAVLFVAPGHPVDLRWIGALKAASLVGLALALTALFRRRPAWMLAHAAIFAFVICDPFNALWLNTLYTEFAALFFAYVCIALLVAICARDTPDEAPSSGVVAAFAVSLVGLGLSRYQHVLLPALLALPVVISAARPAPRAAIAVLVAVFAVALAQFGLVERNPKIEAANSADVVLGALLPASLDPAMTARHLGLPERCLRASGATWYEPMGESLHELCPEALAVARSRQARLLITEPATLVRAALRGLPQLQDWRLGYMGAVEGREYAGIEAVREIAGMAAFSGGPCVASLPLPVFMLALAVSLVLLAVSATVSLVAIAIERRAPLSLSIFALTATAWYAIATAIGGDGYVEVSRHAQLAATCLFATAVLLAITLLAPLLVLVGGPSPSPVAAPIAAMAYAALALGLAALLQPLLLATISTVPMALGVVDRPTHNIVPPGPVEFAGWALDPLGVTAVEIATDNGETIAVAADQPYAGARGEPLALYYPSYPQVAQAGFVAHLPSSIFDRGAVEVRTRVVNATGVRTEIDRRRLVPTTP
jgi:hypothetical protein